MNAYVALQTYRPPTPPLPSRKRTSAPPTPVTATMNKPMHVVRILVHRTHIFVKSVSIQVYPDLTGLGADIRCQRARSPDSDDTVDTHTIQTAHSSLTLWTNRGPSLETSTLTDDDDRTLPVYQPHSVRKSTIESKTMLVVEPRNPGSGLWGTFAHWCDSFLNSFKACLPWF